MEFEIRFLQYFLNRASQAYEMENTTPNEATNTTATITVQHDCIRRNIPHFGDYACFIWPAISCEANSDGSKLKSLTKLIIK